MHQQLTIHIQKLNYIFNIEKNYYDLNDRIRFGTMYTNEALYELSYGTSFKTSNKIRDYYFRQNTL